MRIRRVAGLVSGVIVGALVAHVSTAQRSTGRNPDWDWPTYNRDLAGTRYSPLSQINTANVSTLTQAWAYRLRPEPGVVVSAIDKPASAFEMFQEVTPIVVNGVMYLPSGDTCPKRSTIGPVHTARSPLACIVGSPRPRRARATATASF